MRHIKITLCHVDFGGGVVTSHVKCYFKKKWTMFCTAIRDDDQEFTKFRAHI